MLYNDHEYKRVKGTGLLLRMAFSGPTFYVTLTFKEFLF